MPQTASSLWPAAIRPAIQSPYAVLAAQAEALGKQTNGLLVAELLVRDSDDKKRTYLLLDIYVPALDYRYRVLTASHDKSLVYPVTVDAETFRPRSIAEAAKRFGPVLAGLSRRQKEANEASSDEELIELVKQVLTSYEVVAVAVSLIARAEDAIREKEQLARLDNGSLPDSASDETPATPDPGISTDEDGESGGV